jgi:hypothetical protein
MTALLALLAAGCGSQDRTSADPTEPTPTSATSSAAAEVVHIAVIGDSLAETSWPDLYGEQVAAELGRPVEVDVPLAEAVADAAALVTDPSEVITGADIVIVQTGFNNALRGSALSTPRRQCSCFPPTSKWSTPRPC